MTEIQVAAFMVLASLWTLSRADPDVSCVFMESCILPCSFQDNSDVVMHWIQTAGNLPVHSYYYKEDQILHQDQRFKGRTSLFKEQISRGNASLQLTGVQVQDQGRYKCYTSTIRGNKESFINLRVDAPVSKIHIEQVGNRITCSSEGIYPKPKLTWSINPPSTFKNTTRVQQTEQQLYNISSSLILSDEATDVDYSCSISTRRNSRRATRFKQTSIRGSSSETIPCANSNRPITSFLWRFNHSQIIVEDTGGTGGDGVSEEWRPYVKQVSDTGSLTLQHLTPDQEGVYTCEVSDAEETRVSNTNLWSDADLTPFCSGFNEVTCSFQAGDEGVIHWIQTPGDVRAHSYYYNEDQLEHQDQRFKDRTSLFKDQISRGNASLQLTGVQVQDQGRYKCYTSTNRGNKETFINLRVDAPVSKIHIEQVGNRITCSSEGIYPEPVITWSTNPPSNTHFLDKPRVQQTEQQLYNISSSLILSDHDPDVDYSCSISTRRNSRRATLLKPASISCTDTETSVPCTSSNTIFSSLIWRFNHSLIVLVETGSDVPDTVSEEWRQHVKGVSESGDLRLKDLSSKHEGTYTCEASNAEETFLRNTLLFLPRKQPTDGTVARVMRSKTQTSRKSRDPLSQGTCLSLSPGFLSVSLTSVNVTTMNKLETRWKNSLYILASNILIHDRL